FEANVVFQRSATVPQDRVIRVDPRDGSEVPYGSVITIYVSSGAGGGGGGGGGGVDPPDDAAGVAPVSPP
ncbi:MAG: PASTA domain-containing protein, partial [Micrococcales bacterium]|nr:PASTA domain-containing protein [Micrococcales bacterium]